MFSIGRLAMPCLRHGFKARHFPFPRRSGGPQSVGAEEVIEKMSVQVVSVIIEAISLVVTVGIARFGFKKWENSQKDRRSEFLFKLLEKFREDDDIKRFIYAADYDKQVSEVSEAQKDKALSYIAYICYLKKQSLISEEEFGFFEYEISRVVGNKTCSEYLNFIRDFAKDNQCRDPFFELTEFSQLAKGK